MLGYTPLHLKWPRCNFALAILSDRGVGKRGTKCLYINENQLLKGSTSSIFSVQRIFWDGGRISSVLQVRETRNMPIANTYIQTNARVGPSFSLSRINLHRIIFIRSGLCYFSKPSSLQHLPNLAINFCLCLIDIFIAWTCSASDTVFPGFQTLFHEIIL